LPTLFLLLSIPVLADNARCAGRNHRQHRTKMTPHLNDRLDTLKDRMARLTALVQQSAELAVQSVLTADPVVAQRVFDMDVRIDEEEVQIEQQAIDLLASQPATSELRTITIIIKANSDFERIADCAVNVSQRVLPLVRGSYHAPADLRHMCNSVLTTLRDTIKAFNLADESMARQVLRGDDVIDALYHQIAKDMLSRLETAGGDANLELSTIMIAKNMERIADHCTNVAEDVIYAQTGRIIRHMHAV
jgi:phosphate transport system protein